jgi:predicted transcriptional regulator
MKVLLAIKPEFAKKIFDGTKKFEFRKTIFKDKSIRNIVVYASSPVRRVIGEFEIDHIISLDKESLWQKTYKSAGISKSFFDSYFDRKELAHAIKIKATKKYKASLSLDLDFNIKSPPQSFVYIDN